MTDKPVILTAERAAEWVKYWIGPSDDDKALLSAIATGRTRVIEPMTEKAAREAFYVQLLKWNQTGGAPTNDEAIWLAALRHARVLADEGEGGCVARTRRSDSALR